MTWLLTLGLALLAQPEKTVVLTFDDAVKSHVTFVAPELKQRGFGATFFVTHRWMEDQKNFLSWEEVAAIHQMGFEIGNHSWTHSGFNTPVEASRLAGELALVEHALAKVEVPKPISFAWCGNAFGPESVVVLRDRGYQLARRGMQPEIAYGKMAIGPTYQPEVNHPLLIPTTGDAYPGWTLEHFKKVVAQSKPGRTVILQFHGVPDIAHPWVHTPQERFVEYMDYLEAEEFRVIAMRDLLPLTPDSLPADPALKIRYPEVPAEENHLPFEVEASRTDPTFWLRNALTHGYAEGECAALLGMTEAAYQAEFGARRFAPLMAPEGKLLVLPYPGVRHPRIGFLDGAVSPQRGTKLSVFAPWEGGGYAVFDFPEAIFAGEELIFLAHTHIPTYWDEQHIRIPNVDWKQEEDGAWVNEWVLPNGFAFGMRALPEATYVACDLWFRNGTDAPLENIRSQNCVMLKDLAGFNAQSNEAQVYTDNVCAVPNAEKTRWALVSTEHVRRLWGNAKCPCAHADPMIESLAVGETKRIQARVGFFDDEHLSHELLRWKAGDSGE